MAHPLVSVVIPTYNRLAMLAEAVRSVQTQTFKDFELIVVDDGSDDGSADFLTGLGDNIVTLGQTNQGVAAARNAGIARARGMWIALLDSDDLWHHRKLEQQMAFLHANPRLSICQTEELWMRDGKRVNACLHHKKTKGFIFAACLKLCLISPSCAVFKKSLIDDLGPFDEGFVVCEDYEFWLRIALQHEVGLLEEALVTRRAGHADQLSQRYWGMDLLRIEAMLKIFPLLAPESPEYKALVQEILAKARILLTGFLKHDNELGTSYATSVIAAFAGLSGA